MKINKELVKMAGNGAYRIGKDIIREGTKTVVIKSVGSLLGTVIAEGVEGVKKMSLNDYIGDYSRKIDKWKKKEFKKLRREAREAGVEVRGAELKMHVDNMAKEFSIEDLVVKIDDGEGIIMNWDTSDNDEVKDLEELIKDEKEVTE